jgi:hypothetical protein
MLRSTIFKVIRPSLDNKNIFMLAETKPQINRAPKEPFMKVVIFSILHRPKELYKELTIYFKKKMIKK